MTVMFRFWNVVLLLNFCSVRHHHEREGIGFSTFDFELAGHMDHFGVEGCSTDFFCYDDRSRFESKICSAFAIVEL